MKKFLTLVLGMLISGGALYYLLRGDVETLKTEISGGRYGYMIPAALFYVLALVARGYRWRVLLGYRTSVWHAFHIMNVGYMFNSLPLRVGELARAWMTTRLSPPIAFFTALSSIFVERVLDLLMVMAFLGVSLLFLPVPRQVSISGATIGVITLIMAVLMVYFAHNRTLPHTILGGVQRLLPFLGRFQLNTWLDHLLDGLKPLTSLRASIEALAWSVLGWLLSLITGYYVMLVFFPEGNIPGIMLTIVMLALAVAIPSVPGNLGTFEAAGVAGLYFAGIIAATEAPANAPAVAFSVLLHLMTLGGYVILGMIGLWAEQTSLGQVRSGMAQVNTMETD